eukprot:3039277-Prymnesium_polylepis.2
MDGSLERTDGSSGLPPQLSHDLRRSLRRGNSLSAIFCSAMFSSSSRLICSAVCTRRSSHARMRRNATLSTRL